MTDARLPERWLSDRRLLRLSDAAHRLHITGLLWCVANRTDGLIPESDLELLPRVDVGRTVELEKAELWRHVGDNWLLADFGATQTSADELTVLENARRRDREKKARQRAAAKSESPQDTPEGLSPGTSLGTAQAGQAGQARQDRPRRKDSSELSAKRCEKCSGFLPAAVVVAGWTTHPNCDTDWPTPAAIPA